MYPISPKFDIVFLGRPPQHLLSDLNRLRIFRQTAGCQTGSFKLSAARCGSSPLLGRLSYFRAFRAA